MKKKFLIFSVCLLSMAITSCGSNNNPPEEDKLIFKALVSPVAKPITPSISKSWVSK